MRISCRAFDRCFSAVTDAVRANLNRNGERLLEENACALRTRAEAHIEFICGCMINSDASAGMQLQARFKFTLAALIHGRSPLVSHKICKSILKYTARSSDFIFTSQISSRKSPHYLSRCIFYRALIRGSCTDTWLFLKGLMFREDKL